MDYLIHAKAYDGKEMKSFRALYGYNYVQNGWMGDIWSIECNDITYIKATVSPSQPGVGRKDYNAWIAVSKYLSVETGHCSCPAGNARSCSHISAIIYAITLAWSNGVGGETCTDKQRTWGKGAAQVLCHDRLADMTFDRPSQFELLMSTDCIGPKTSDLPRTKQFIDHTNMKEFVASSSVQGLWECSGTLLYSVLHAPEISNEAEEDTPHGEHTINCVCPVSLPLSCPKCQTFYEAYVQLTHSSKLEKATKQQNNSTWTDSRKLRITSSRVSDLPKTNRANPDKFINNHIYSRFKGCAATRHGQRYEPVARAWYERLSGKTVSPSGIVVCEEEPYLAASPDGILDPHTIVEIKCPVRPLNDLISSGKYDVMLVGGKPVLNPKGKNGYFCQVQCAMYCTKADLCKFVVWTADKQCVIDVAYDQAYMDQVLPRIREFYFRHLLVRLADEFSSKRLKLSSEYRSVCGQKNR